MDPRDDNLLFNRLLLEQIKSKLIGEARDVLINSRCTRWGEIKDLLTQKFGDPRSEELLLHDMTTCFQNSNETYENYFDNIKRKLQILLEHVSIRELNQDIRISKENMYTSQALNTFKAGILEPHCSHLLNLSINSLEQALMECRKFDNERCQINFMNFIRNQSKGSQSQKRYVPPLKNHYNAYNKQFKHFSNSAVENNKPSTSHFPSQPINLQKRNESEIHRNFPTNSQVFGKRIPERKPDYKPTPMSISSRVTHRNNAFNNHKQNYFTPKSRPSFISEEVYNIEENVDEDNTFENPEEDFYTEASETELE
ncbi:hypothetical protein HHI36_005797 [Cryptolaemus montrouzieri]|uniref:Uncharacterized protein n=1 Tax=Cryptolaemus montrouzieri TaxID=559131 RepID=A0ABD2NV78_9CUCU